MDESRKKSAKPSATNADTRAERLRKDTGFFVDRCLGRRLPEALREAGFRIECHEDHFADDLEDEAWLKEVGARGWAVFTKDKNIRRHPTERKALIDANVRLFLISGGCSTFEKMKDAIINNIPKIGRFLKNNPPPFVASIIERDVRKIDLD